MIRIAITSFLSLLVLSGCASKDKSQTVEVPPPPGATVSDAPEETLFEQSRGLFAGEVYSQARGSFEALANTYPVGPYAEFAALKAADAHFEIRDYETAAKIYESFAKERPGSEALDYALVQSGRSFQLSHGGLGRDTGPLERALEIYNELISKFPDSPYSAHAIRLRAEVLSALAAHEKLVRDFYKKRGAHDAYQAREERLEQHFRPELEAQEEKLAKLAPIPAATLLADVKTRSGAESMSRERLVKEGDDSSEGNEQEKDLRRREERIAVATEGRKGLHTIRQIDCIKSVNAMITISLDSYPQAGPLRDFIDNTTSLTPKDGKITISLPGIRGEVINKACLAEGRVTLSPDATLIFSSDGAAKPLLIDNPPRLIFVVQ